VQELRDAGYLPEAVRNYLALLGWGYDDSTTFFSTEELVERFSLERVSRSPAVFDEKKLRWMNGRYVRDMEEAELTRRLEERLGRGGLSPAVRIAREKMQTLDEFWPLAGFLFERKDYDERAWRKVMRDGAGDRLGRARTALAEAEPFAEPEIERALRGLVEELEVKPGVVFQPVRVAISGTSVSPGIFESVALLGREETLARIDLALARA
ncbi:MAG: glutamate--tRNA ligase family protein, partial [Thermoleophilaceae bacterium]